MITADNDTPPFIGIGPRVRKSPFYDATRRYGAKAFTIYNHTYMPLYYESPEADFWRLVNDTTIWDVAGERQVEVSGPDAARLVQYMTPRDLSAMEPGRARYVVLCDEKGGIINDPVLLKFSDERWWFSTADADVLLWAKALAHTGDYNVQVREPDVSPLQIQGPKSVYLLADLVGDWLWDMRYFRFAEAEIDGIPVVISRTGWSGERGYEVYLRDSRDGDRLWERLFEAGKPYGAAPGAPSQIRRIEAGLLSYGSDITLNTNPFEIGLGRLVDLDSEADFCGKLALREIAERGVMRHLVGLEIAGDPIAPNEHFWPMEFGDGRWGHLTSAIYSPRLEKNIAIGYVPVHDEQVGTPAKVHAAGRMLEAQVAAMPFYDPRKALATA